MNPPPPHYYPQLYTPLPLSTPQISNQVMYPAEIQNPQKKDGSQIYTQVYYNLNKNFKVSDLKELCKKLFLQKQGRRSQLIEQLATYLTAHRESLAIKTNLTEKQREVLFAPTPSPSMNFINSHISSNVHPGAQYVTHYARNTAHSAYLGGPQPLRPQLMGRPPAPRFPYNQTFILRQLKPEHIEKTCKDSYYFLYNKQPLAIHNQDIKYACICGNQNHIRGGSVFRLQCRLCKNFSHSHCYGISPPQTTDHTEFECVLCIASRINPLLLPLFREPGSNDLFNFLCYKPAKDANASRPSNLNRKSFKISPHLLSEMRRPDIVVQVRIIKIGPRSACFPKLNPDLQDCYEMDTPWNFSFTLNNQKYESKTEPAQYVKKKNYELHDFSKELCSDNKFDFRYWPFFQNESDKKPRDDFEFAVVVMLFVKAQEELIRFETYKNFTGDQSNPIYKDEENDEIAVEAQTLDLFCPFNRQIMEMPCRGAKCTHRKCFDLACYLGSNNYECKYWKCPHCNRKTTRLYVDKFIEHIIKIGKAEGLLKNYSVRLEKNATRVEFHKEEFDDEFDQEDEFEGEKGSEEKKEEETNPTSQKLKDLQLITFTFDPENNLFQSKELERKYELEDVREVKGEDEGALIQKSKGQLKTTLHYKEEDGVILLEDSDEDEEEEELKVEEEESKRREERSIIEVEKSKESGKKEAQVYCISDSEGVSKSSSQGKQQLSQEIQLQNLLRSRLRNYEAKEESDNFIPDIKRKGLIMMMLRSLPILQPAYQEMSRLQATFSKESISDETPEDEFQGIARAGIKPYFLNQRF